MVWRRGLVGGDTEIENDSVLSEGGPREQCPSGADRRRVTSPADGTWEP